MTTTPDERGPASVYGVGSEPDPRFSLANERTALAWIRTGFALVAGGVALSSLAVLADLSVLLEVVAAASCLGGGAVAARALLGWRRYERALRLGQPLPAPRSLPALVAGVVIMAVALAVHAVVVSVR